LIASYPDTIQAEQSADPFDAADRDVLKRLALADFPGAGIRRVAGMYQSAPETGLQAEVIVSLSHDPAAYSRLLALAEALAYDWDQEEIWLTHEPVGLTKVRL
jgi:hypothetical protein